MSTLLVRIFDVDFYMSSPVPNLDVTFSQFRGSSTHQVPVIRVFGSTDAGKKICVHIHGIFPYFYIPYDGSEPASGLMYKIASNLDKAINISLGHASSNNQHIYKIVLVSGIPFYGYHSKKHQFFKVFLYNPMLIKRVNNLLFNESVLGKIYQPHETHLNFTLQFMIDYNLHGMSNIVLSQVKFRNNIGVRENEEFSNEENLLKVSSCELECDILGEHILNRQEIESGNLAANPGIAALWEDERQRRRNKNENSQLPHYLSLSKTDIPPTESHELFKRALRERLAILSQDSDKMDLNLSVYPAECPQNQSILNCSNIDFHSPLNSQSDLSCDSELDQTLLNDTINITLDQDVQDLLDVLKDLEKNVDVEDDSILSQVSKNECEDIEEDHDMTITIEGCEDLLNETLQLSQVYQDRDKNQYSEIRTSSENTVRRKDYPDIPQLDGNCPDLEVENSVSKISGLQGEPGNVFIDFNLEKSRSYSSMNENREMILHREKNNILFSYVPNTPNFENKSIVLKIETFNEKAPIDSSVECQTQVCPLNHKYLHVEESLCKKLHSPRIMEARKLNERIIRSIRDEKHQYFSAPSIGERVALKNASSRNKVMLNDLLKYPCELVCISENLQLPQVSVRKRDMPSLNFHSASDESCAVSAVTRWEEIKRTSLNESRHSKIDEFKKNIRRQRFFHRREEVFTKDNKRQLLVQKFCKQYDKCWDDVNRGAKPTFKIIPGYRPYSFKPVNFKREESIETQSTNCIQLTRTELISSNITTEQHNSTRCDLNQNKIVDTDETAPISSGKTELKRNKVQNKLGAYSLNSIKQTNTKKQPLRNTRMKAFTKKCIMKNIEKTKTSLKDSSKEDGTGDYDSIEDNCNEKPTQLKSMEDILRAQKQNESLFFSSVNSLMDNFSISESKILKSSEDDLNCAKVNRADIQFLDGAFDDSDEGDSNKHKSRSSKKTKSAYSSLPIFKSSRSSGESTSNTLQTDSKKDNKTESKIGSVTRFDRKNVKRIINFDSCSQIDANSEEKISQNAEPSKPSIPEYPKAKLPAIIDNEDSMKDQCKDIPSDSCVNALAEHYYSKIQQKTINPMIFSEGYVETNKTQDLSDNKSEQMNKDSEPPKKISEEQNEQKNQDHIYRPRNFFPPSVAEVYDYINGFIPLPSTSKSTDPSIMVPPEPNDSEFEEDAWLSTPEHGNFLDSPDTAPAPNVLAKAELQSSGMIGPELPNYSNDSVYFKPLYKPPTRLDVEQNLSEYGIPQIRPQEPFYSNADDASGSMEVGYNVLKIRTLTTMGVPDFNSNFEGLDEFRTKYFGQSVMGTNANLRHFFCPEGTCTIIPVNKPPTCNEVKSWIKQNSIPTKVVEKTTAKKSKIYFASSQDIYSDNDMSMDLTLTLSPTTPKTEKIITQTPESDADNVDFIPKEARFNSHPSTPVSSRRTRSVNRTTEINPDTPESIDNDRPLRDDCNSTLSPISSQSRSSPILTKSRPRRKLDMLTTLRKSALLSHSSDHSEVISGVSLNNTYGFQCSVQNYQNARASIKYEHLTILTMELHINTRDDFKPNPQYDCIQAIFYYISNDVEENIVKPRKCEGLFAINPKSENQGKSSSFLDGAGVSCDIKYVQNELELIEEFSKFVIQWDPDILLGYEIQMLSWGYFIERCFHLGINIIPEISRVKDKHLKFNDKETGDLRVSGRVVLDLWRLLRHEIALQSYTIQSTVYEILHRRIPKYSFKDLTTWWSHSSSLFRHRTVNYYLTCVTCQLKILEQLDFVGRTSELARLFGIQFYEVLSRGSQFRVESMMLRLAKPLNYVAVSPSVQQRARMKAPEHIALVLEPESKLYTDPVIVLDFQSLYPSIIIAYNYCFSTCVGRVELLGKDAPFEFGASNLKVSRERIKQMLTRNLFNFSPCGVAFVKKSVRDGIMPRMLREILDTRLMVKKSMKENKEDTVLQKVLHSRQLGLKLIANVTYGYTAANFSGRMPSVELGDSIVSKARETLQRAISLVDNNKEWGVRVVYGDTDSLFVLCPGKSRTEAFSIGEKIVEAVGRENPDPVKLKLEKVYQPCILQTKKRYVGYMYESPEQEVPTYDAKGIETVRRDGCPAVSKMLEKTLRILFETKDMSKVKEYCVKQFNKINLGRISIKDLTFAKEYRGFTGYRPGACVPSLELAKKWVAVDKRAEPRRGERVPYVIINGPPGLPLIRMVRSPYDLLKDPTLRPNALYYITRVIIPPLNRCFNLIGADLHHWFLQMPRKHSQYLPTVTSPTKKSTISQYFISTLCAVCGVQTQNGLCGDCCKKPQETVTILEERARQWEASYNNCKLICSSCTQILDDPKCISLDCPVLYRLNQTSRDLQQADHIRHLLSQYFDIS